MDKQGITEVIRLVLEERDGLLVRLGELEKQIDEARSILGGSRRLPNRSQRVSNWLASGRPRSRDMRPGSSTSRALAVLREHGGPLAATELTARVNELGRPVTQSTLVSNVSRMVAHRDTFTRVGMSLFGLAEFAAGEQKDVVQ